jgi:hypothetical protein
VGFDGSHRGGQLDRQPALRDGTTEDDVEDGVVGSAEVGQQGGGVLGEFRHDGGPIEEDVDHRRHGGHQRQQVFSIVLGQVHPALMEERLREPRPRLVRRADPHHRRVRSGRVIHNGRIPRRDRGVDPFHVQPDSLVQQQPSGEQHHRPALRVGSGGLAAGLRARARPVLDHRRHRIRSQVRPLQTFDVGGGQPGDHLRVGAERARGAAPPRFGRQVGHRVQGQPDPDRRVLGAHHFGERAHRIGVGQRAEPERFGPARTATGRRRRQRVLVRRVPRVGRDEHRDAQPAAGRHPLDFVVPAGKGPGRDRRHQRQAADVPVPHHFRRRRDGQRAGRLLDETTVGGDRHRGVEKQPGLLRQGHPAEQVTDALLGGPRGILVREHAAEHDRRSGRSPSACHSMAHPATPRERH